MELKDIKQQLTISQVLQHYGLKPDKNNRLLCVNSCHVDPPFLHVDPPSVFVTGFDPDGQ